MNMLKQMSICLLGLGMCMLASADVYLGKYEGYEYYLLPSKTKQVTNSKYEVTMERYVAKDVKKDGIAQGGYTLYKRYIDCKNRTVGTISWANYTKANKLINNDKVNHVKYYDIFPRSWGSALYDEVCR